jgi:site-specific DNA-methyltransferase (adenine-specific)
MRRLVYVALPLGTGVVADPFMGSGATVAAGEAVGVQMIGLERVKEYFDMAVRSIPRLVKLATASDELVGNSAGQGVLWGQDYA